MTFILLTLSVIFNTGSIILLSISTRNNTRAISNLLEIQKLTRR